MSHAKPFHRNYRGFAKGSSQSGYSEWAYIVDRDYSDSPEHYVRAFLLIQRDLRRVFEFVEPSNQNLSTHSFRIHELFIRACIEVEANFKAILRENIYSPTDLKGKDRKEKDWNMTDYRKVNVTHHLAAYKIHIPIWDGLRATFEPFKQWETDSALPWYQAYNSSKHDRKVEFRKANFENLLNSVAGLLVLLSSQFKTQDFSPSSTLLEVETDNYYSTNPALGSFFHIEFPDDWSEAEKYDFNWCELGKQEERFQKINYDKI